MQQMDMQDLQEKLECALQQADLEQQILSQDLQQRIWTLFQLLRSHVT